jgi:hypothetical protein
LTGVLGAKPLFIHPSGKLALQNRIHPAAFEPISHSATISRLALIERAQRLSITISRQINQKPPQLSESPFSGKSLPVPSRPIVTYPAYTSHPSTGT